MDVLEDIILFRVTQQRKEDFKPKFMNCWRRTGHLIINCQNYETAEWLESLMAIISPWDGADLEAVDADLIPRLEVMEAMFWRSALEDDDTIMVYVESQNNGLSTANWRVIQRKIIREQHVKLLFTVDEATMRHFRENDYVINFKFGQTIIRKHNSESTDKNDGKNIQGKEVNMIDDPECDDNVICESSGNNALLVNREVQLVPETSQSQKSNTQGESTSHLKCNQQTSGPNVDQRLRNSKQNTTQITDLPSHSTGQSSRSKSDQLVDRRNLSYTLDQNGDGRSKNQKSFVQGKNQKPSFKKHGNYSGSSANRSNSELPRQRRDHGSPKGIQRKGHY